MNVIVCMMTFALLFSNAMPKFSIVETKALFISADILKRQPLLKQYFTLSSLAEQITKAFLISHGMSAENSTAPVPAPVTPKSDAPANEPALCIAKPAGNINLGAQGTTPLSPSASSGRFRLVLVLSWAMAILPVYARNTFRYRRLFKTARGEIAEYIRSLLMNITKLMTAEYLRLSVFLFLTNNNTLNRRTA